MISYIYDDRGISGAIYKNHKYKFIKNILGDIILIVNESLDVICEYTYTAYGKYSLNDLSTINSIDSEFVNYNPFTYRGYYKDHESNLYYLINRYYSPDIEMFITPDSFNYLDPSTLYGLDLYTYCMFNPLISGNTRNLFLSPIFSNLKLLKNEGFIKKYRYNKKHQEVNWNNNEFQIPIWITLLLTGTDHSSSIIPVIRTLYQYIRYPYTKELNKFYGQKLIPGRLNTICSAIGYTLLGTDVILSAISNFTNDDLTPKQQWIGFGTDTVYTLATYTIGYGVGELVSLIPVVGVFLAPIASAGIVYIIEWTNEKWGWVDEIKQWLNDL